MELTVLGCSGSYGAPAGGACSGYLVRAGDANIWMDCGNGTFTNLQQHIGDLERVLQHFLARFGPVGEAAGVAEVHDALVGQQVDQRAQDRQTAEPRVEHADGTPGHQVPWPAARRSRSATAAPIPTSAGTTASTVSRSAASAARRWR